MAKKAKEQVKYNPNFSGEKRVWKINNTVNGGAGLALSIFIGIVGAIMFVPLCIGSLVDATFFMEDEENTVSLFSCGIVFMTFMGFMTMATLPIGNNGKNGGLLTSNMERSTMKGCARVSNLLMHMPLRKVDMVRQSFHAFLPVVGAAVLPQIITNVGVVIYGEKLNHIKAAAGLTGLMIPLILLALYCVCFGIVKMSDKVRKNTMLGVIVVFYILWLGLIAEPVAKVVFNLRVLQMLAGVPSLCICAACVALIFSLQKLYVEKKQIKAAWEF